MASTQRSVRFDHGLPNPGKHQEDGLSQEQNRGHAFYEVFSVHFHMPYREQSEVLLVQRNSECENCSQNWSTVSGDPRNLGFIWTVRAASTVQNSQTSVYPENGFKHNVTAALMCVLELCLARRYANLK
jgi:hypothetical protein